ncbi:carnitine O-palmitoyltransferase 2, mitochondrial-like isoform X2 [Scylla paramamosain]|uniref:carnitine O-palmitoyltransferase 2, mitochondrial-like isoform X2 n=1 Tax=Scylla paramamosain TaxID=85552 RepID=UPI00308363A2
MAKMLTAHGRHLGRCVVQQTAGLGRGVAMCRLHSSPVWCSTFDVKSDDYQYIHKSKIPTMHFQKSLLRLPIPALDKTCERYLRSQKVILSSEEYQRTEKFVTQFKEGIGATLQFQLKDIDKANKHTSYICGPWFDMYLSDRVPVVLNYNPFLAFHPEERPGLSDPVIRVTNTLVSSLRFMRSLRDSVLEPVVYHLNPAKSDTPMFRKIVRWTPSAISSYAAYAQKAFPLDMSQFGNMFNSTRIPKLGKDVLRTYPKARHMLIMKNGHFYVFDVLDKDGNILSPEHIHACVSYIYNDQTPPAKRSIAIFTTENRDTWAKCRDELVEAGNEAALDVLDAAAFNIVFDEAILGDDPIKTYHTFLHGDGNNRWFDKSFSLICTADSQLALNFEHGWGDGVAVMNYFTEITKDLANRPSINSDSRPAPIDASKLVRRLEFTLTPSLEAAIDKAHQSYEANTSALKCDVLEPQFFGKKLCKKNKLSPDALMQLGLQLTCGVPQGTKMGPLCFLLLINDALTDTPHRWKYVYDCTVGVPVSTKNPDYSPLQAILERLQMWTEESRMTINHNKTVVMHFCTSSVPVPPPQLSVGPHPLQVVRCAKLLGVTVDDQLTWKQHVASTIRSATYRLYMLRRLRSLGTPTDELRGVYLTFILPKLMYASPAWSSSLTQTQQLQLESVQKRACRVILGPAYTTYEEALNTLKLSRLSTRYSEALEKFGRGLLNHPRLRSLLPPDAPRPTRATRHHNKITPLKAPRTDRYRLSAIPTMVRAINQ